MSRSAPVVQTIRLHPDVMLPEPATERSAGFDLRAYLTGTPPELSAGGMLSTLKVRRGHPDRTDTPYIVVPPGATAKIPLGLRTELPVDLEAQIRPRSGLSWRSALRIANAPGTVDADFRGEWMVLAWNSGTDPLPIFHQDAIAQAVFAPVVRPRWVDVNFLPPSRRGAGGFGSTGG